jgi:hypothetical protein
MVCRSKDFQKLWLGITHAYYIIYTYMHVYTWVHQINSEISCGSYLIFLLSHKLFSSTYLRIILDALVNRKIASKFFLKCIQKSLHLRKNVI